jgi:hypothetical protein
MFCTLRSSDSKHVLPSVHNPLWRDGFFGRVEVVPNFAVANSGRDRRTSRITNLCVCVFSSVKILRMYPVQFCTGIKVIYFGGKSSLMS